MVDLMWQHDSDIKINHVMCKMYAEGVGQRPVEEGRM